MNGKTLLETLDRASVSPKHAPDCRRIMGNEASAIRSAMQIHEAAVQNLHRDQIRHSAARMDPAELSQRLRLKRAAEAAELRVGAVIAEGERTARMWGVL